jgi:hypothetical protein
MSKIKEVMLLALVADGSIEMKIADAGKVVNTIYDALKCPASAPMRQIGRVEEGRISGSS